MAVNADLATRIKVNNTKIRANSTITKLTPLEVVQLLHSCGPLFKIIRACGPQPARNTYFCPKIIAFFKKKGLYLKSVSEIPIFVPKL